MQTPTPKSTTILYHHRTQGQGAEWVHSHYIIDGFRKLGVQVIVMGPFGEVTHHRKQNVSDKSTSIKAKILRTLSKILPQVMFELLELTYNYVARARLEKIIQRQKIDCIYERHAFFFSAGVKLAKKYHIPMVIEVNEIAGTKRVRKQTLVKLSQRIEKYVFTHVKRIFVVSDMLKQNIMRYNIPADKIQILPNAVDIIMFSPLKVKQNLRHKFKIENRNIVLGFVGGFAPWHNVELLIHAFAKLIHKKPLHLLLVGEGKLKPHYRKLCDKLGILEHVTFTGFLGHTDLPAVINVMDICIMPGSNDFGSPLKIFEYMALAKPVVAPRYGPIEAVIEHEVNGLLFTPLSQQDLLTSLERLILDERFRKKLGTTARQMLIDQKHTWTDNCRIIFDAVFNKAHQP